MEQQKANIFDLNLKKKTYCAWHKNPPRVNHTVIEGMGIAFEDLENDTLAELLEEFCKKLRFNIVDRVHYQFTPHGKSIVFVLKESHIGIHSWPEKGYVHMDLVTCARKEPTAKKITDEFKKIFKPRNTRLIKLKY